MDRKTLAALRKSIKHWKENLKAARKGNDIEMSDSDCPLCSAFSSGNMLKTDCLKCPVKLKTGHRYCKRTPYFLVAKVEYGEQSTVVAAVQAELDFLKSLLPAKAAK